MKQQYLRGVVLASTLLLAATVNPATAQSPAISAQVSVASAAIDQPADNSPIDHRMLWIAGVGVVIFLAGRRPA